jgi:hypothetical protein
MPLTPSGDKVMTSMQTTYGPEKGKRIFYASINKGKPGSQKWEGASKTPVAPRALSKR